MSATPSRVAESLHTLVVGLCVLCFATAVVFVVLRATRTTPTPPAPVSARVVNGTVECHWTCDDPTCRAPCTAVCAAPTCVLQSTTATPQEGWGVAQEAAGISACEVRCPTDAVATEDCPQCETVCPTAPPGKRWNCAATACEWDCATAPAAGSCQEPTCTLVCQRPACAAQVVAPLR